MKKNLIAASVFLFGLGLGGTAAAFSTSGGTHITPEQAACISACRAAGGANSTCYMCCVQGDCPET